MRLKLRATLSAGDTVPARWAATIAATVSVTRSPDQKMPDQTWAASIGAAKQRLRVRNGSRGSPCLIVLRGGGLSHDRSKRCAMCTTELQEGFKKINSYYQALDRYFAGVIGPRQSRLLIL